MYIVYNILPEDHPRICFMGGVNYNTLTIDASECFLLGCVENKTLLVFPGVEQDHYTSAKRN